MGERPAVVLLHGQPGSALHWRRVIDRLPDELRVIAEDRPGYGTNALPPTGLFGNAAAVVERLDQLGVGRAVITGHSWAGGVALALAERHPDRVAGLALVSSVGPGAVSVLDRALALPVLGEAASWAFFRMAAPVVRQFHAGQQPDEWRTFVVEQQQMVKELPMVVGGLGIISAPTIVLAGGADRIVRSAVADALASHIPGAELRLLAGEGHVLPLTAPIDVAAAISALARRPARRPAPTTAPPPP